MRKALLDLGVLPKNPLLETVIGGLGDRVDMDNISLVFLKPTAFYAVNLPQGF
jgi:hypothetical protein